MPYSYRLETLKESHRLIDTAITKLIETPGHDEYKVKDVIQSYRNYYMGAKSGFTTWKNRETPSWFLN